MAIPRNITAKLNAIEAAAKARFADSPYVPRHEWSPELKAAHKVFAEKLSTYRQFGFENKYEYLLHLQETVATPPYPLKPEFDHLRCSNRIEDKLNLYQLTKAAR
ncbi:hypothetical protein D2T29_22470 [Sinirhodobacter populi]|uniref:Uncharacterized protein n=2 Tax=Paenirhodobacter populi TaxID=2306993 RepID=A0A443JWS3_9RHOB|nr:hypothetical protein [Sinirhodobacter populi]RWR24949.1 hypothetical protein D2T29_22470 [Sinirhodobacter populi]